MAQLAEIEAPPRPSAVRARRRPQAVEVDRPRFLYVVVAAVLCFLFVPSIIVIVFSFNSNRSLVTFYGFSTRWYQLAFQSATLRQSFVVSVEIGLIATVIATVCGTLMALGVSRAGVRSAKLSSGQLITRLIMPETAIAAALFLFFTRARIPFGIPTIVVAHVALCLPFVTIIVYGRLAGLSAEVEEAAMDLGATRLDALRLVVLPVIWPAVAAAAILAFVLSFDNFITSLFMSGTNTPPLPLAIYSMLRFGVTPVVNVIGIVMVIVSAGAVAIAYLFGRLARNRSNLRRR